MFDNHPFVLKIPTPSNKSVSTVWHLPITPAIEALCSAQPKCLLLNLSRKCDVCQATWSSMERLERLSDYLGMDFQSSSISTTVTPEMMRKTVLKTMFRGAEMTVLKITDPIRVFRAFLPKNTT